MLHSFPYTMFQETMCIFSLFLFYVFTEQLPFLHLHFKTFVHFRAHIMNKIIENASHSYNHAKVSFIKTSEIIKQILDRQKEGQKEEKEENKEKEETSKSLQPPQIRYEDKYLEQLRLLPDEYVLTDDEKINEGILFEKFLLNAKKKLEKSTTP